MLKRLEEVKPSQPTWQSKEPELATSPQGTGGFSIFSWKFWVLLRSRVRIGCGSPRWKRGETRIWNDKICALTEPIFPLPFAHTLELCSVALLSWLQANTLHSQIHHALILILTASDQAPFPVLPLTLANCSHGHAATWTCLLSTPWSPQQLPSRPIETVVPKSRSCRVNPPEAGGGHSTGHPYQRSFYLAPAPLQ